MLITNLEIVPGKRVVEHLGLVNGSSVRAKHVGREKSSIYRLDIESFVSTTILTALSKPSCCRNHAKRQWTGCRTKPNR